MHDSQTLFAAVQERTSSPADSIHALFQAQAKRTPHATAVEYAGTRLTYRDLNERAERFASIAAALAKCQTMGLSARACSLESTVTMVIRWTQPCLFS